MTQRTDAPTRQHPSPDDRGEPVPKQDPESALRTGPVFPRLHAGLGDHRGRTLHRLPQRSLPRRRARRERHTACVPFWRSATSTERRQLRETRTFGRVRPDTSAGIALRGRLARPLGFAIRPRRMATTGLHRQARGVLDIADTQQDKRRSDASWHRQAASTSRFAGKPAGLPVPRRSSSVDRDRL